MAAKKLFSEEEYQKILQVAPEHNKRSLLEFCHEELNRPDISYQQINRYAKNYPELGNKLSKGRRGSLFNKEQEAFIRENAEGRSTHQLVDMFNKHFGTSVPFLQMQDWTRRRPDIRNKMRRMVKSDPEYIKSMYDSRLRRPIGAIHQYASGTKMKISDGRGNDDWVSRTRIVWENANGYTDKMICHLDGDPNNDSLDNLAEVSHQASFYMSLHGLWVHDDPELTRARIAMAEVKVLANKMQRKVNEQETTKESGQEES